MNYCEINHSDSTFDTFLLKLSCTLGFGSIISWFSHVGYYRLHGHPWKLSNGPTVNLSTKASKNSLKCEYFIAGGRKKIELGYHYRSSPNQDLNDEEYMEMTVVDDST